MRQKSDEVTGSFPGSPGQLDDQLIITDILRNGNLHWRWLHCPRVYLLSENSLKGILYLLCPFAAKWLNTVIAWCFLFVHVLPIVRFTWSVQVHFPTIPLRSFDGCNALLAFWGFWTITWTPWHSVQSNDLLEEATVWGWYYAPNL